MGQALLGLSLNVCGKLTLVNDDRIDPSRSLGKTPPPGVSGKQRALRVTPHPCMDRTHGGRVFGDMVDTFEYVRHRA